MRPDGTLYGEGVGLVMGQGGEAASYVGQDVGTMQSGGSVSWRGAFYYQTQSAAWKRGSGPAPGEHSDSLRDGEVR